MKLPIIFRDQGSTDGPPALGGLITLQVLLIFLHLAAILEICKLDSEDGIFQLANISFGIQHTKIPLLGISKPFLHKIPRATFLNKRLFLIFFLDYIFF